MSVIVHRGTSNKYVISLGHALFNPADSLTQYWGDLEGIAPSAVAGIVRCIILRPGVIKYVAINAVVAGTLGTSESVAYYVRLNDTTDYLISNAVTLSAVQQTITAALSIPVNTDDFIEIKMVCPAWATNPTSVVHSASLLIE